MINVVLKLMDFVFKMIILYQNDACLANGRLGRRGSEEIVDCETRYFRYKIPRF